MEFLTDSNGKVKLLFNDYVIKFDLCNFKCDYCLNIMEPKNTDIWVETKNELLEDKKIKDNVEIENLLADMLRNENVYSKENELGKRINKMLDHFEDIIDTPILRLSGGELFGIKNIEEFIKERGSKYEVVQIVTNGYYLSEELVGKLKECKNVHIHFSLDGHTLQMNNKRVKYLPTQERLLRNLEFLIENEIPVEINSVMSNCNTSDYLSFLDYLMKYENKIIVFPTPIRGKKLEEHQPDEESKKVFYKLVEQYDTYKNILPPKQYFEYLARFYQDGVRDGQCFLPQFCIQSLDDGVVTPCALCWTKQLGNLFVENLDEVQGRIGKDRVYNLLWQKRPRLEG